MACFSEGRCSHLPKSPCIHASISPVTRPSSVRRKSTYFRATPASVAPRNPNRPGAPVLSGRFPDDAVQCAAQDEIGDQKMTKNDKKKIQISKNVVQLQAPLLLEPPALPFLQRRTLSAVTPPVWEREFGNLALHFGQVAAYAVERILFFLKKSHAHARAVGNTRNGKEQNEEKRQKRTRGQRKVHLGARQGRRRLGRRYDRHLHFPRAHKKYMQDIVLTCDPVGRQNRQSHGKAR